MLGKTHLAVGLATSLAIMQPYSVQELFIGVGAAAIGSLIPDIDVGTSESHRDADIITLMTVVSIAVIAVADKVFHAGVAEVVLSQERLMRFLPCALLFIGVCAFGKEQPHRSFMHSFLAMAILSVLVGIVIPIASLYFALGFASHLITDLFNFKEVRLLYPLKKGLAFHMFHARGVANTVLSLMGTGLALIEFIAHLVRLANINSSQIYG